MYCHRLVLHVLLHTPLLRTDVYCMYCQMYCMYRCMHCTLLLGLLGLLTLHPLPPPYHESWLHCVAGCRVC